MRINFCVPASALASALVAVGVLAILAGAVGYLPRGVQPVGVVLVCGACTLFVVRRLERKVDEVVNEVVTREVSSLLEREVAAYHLGKSRSSVEPAA